MLSTCSRCVAHYAPNADADASGIFCGDCTRRLKRQESDAETYQQQIASGHPGVIPETEADGRKVRAAIRRRYGHTLENADTKMVTHRDKKRNRNA